MTHFWPDYTALIAGLRHEACIWPNSPLEGLLKCAADALEAERKVRTEEYAIAKHLRAEALAAKQRAEAERDQMDRMWASTGARASRLTTALAAARGALDAAWMLTSDKRIPPWVREALLAALSHPTTEPAKAEEP